MLTRQGIEYNPPGTLASNPPGIDTSINSVADLAAVDTTVLALPATKQWINAEDGTFQVWYGYLSTAETGDGVQRSDFWTADRPWTWFRAST